MPKDTCSHSKNCVWRAATRLYEQGSQIRAHHLCVAMTDAGEPCGVKAVAALGRSEDEYGMFYGVPLCTIHSKGVIAGVRRNLSISEKRQATTRRKNPSPKERWIEKHDAVYFARRGNDVKIGHSVQPDKRLRGLEAQGGFRFDEIVVTLGGRALEQRYHRRFAEERHTGEWFTMCDEIRKEMDRLKIEGVAA